MEKERFQKHCPSCIISIMLSDLLGVSQRYIDRELFVSPRQIKNLFTAQKGDQEIKAIVAVLEFMNRV